VLISIVFFIIFIISFIVYIITSYKVKGSFKSNKLITRLKARYIILVVEIYINFIKLII
jgi:hypothetical protein